MIQLRQLLQVALQILFVHPLVVRVRFFEGGGDPAADILGVDWVKPDMRIAALPFVDMARLFLMRLPRRPAFLGMFRNFSEQGNALGSFHHFRSFAKRHGLHKFIQPGLQTGPDIYQDPGRGQI